MAVCQLGGTHTGAVVRVLLGPEAKYAVTWEASLQASMRAEMHLDDAYHVVRNPDAGLTSWSFEENDAAGESFLECISLLNRFRLETLRYTLVLVRELCYHGRAVYSDDDAPDKGSRALQLLLAPSLETVGGSAAVEMETPADVFKLIVSFVEPVVTEIQPWPEPEAEGWSESESDGED
jgi:hypothetical protein